MKRCIMIWNETKLLDEDMRQSVWWNVRWGCTIWWKMRLYKMKYDINTTWHETLKCHQALGETSAQKQMKTFRTSNNPQANWGAHHSSCTFCINTQHTWEKELEQTNLQKCFVNVEWVEKPVYPATKWGKKTRKWEKIQVKERRDALYR